MNTLLSLSLLVATTSLAQAASVLTVDTMADSHSQGFSSQGSPNSTSSKDSHGHTSLRSALEFASTSGGAWTINLPVGAYDLSLGDLVVGVQANTTIMIQGLGTPANTSIHQTQSHRMVFVVNYNVNENVVFTLENVTVSGGTEDSSDPDGFGGNGGAILAGGSSTAPGNALTLNNVVFTGNTTSGNADGGGVDMVGGGNLTVVNCTFSGNRAGVSGNGAGGGIYFDAGFEDGNVSITGSTFANNAAIGSSEGLGGGIYLAGAKSNNTFTVNGCTFLGNSAGNRGGGIDLESGHLTANFNRITGNSAPVGTGHGLFVLSSGAGWADARNNWWGGNLGPNGTGGDSVATSASFSSGTPPPSSTPPLSNGEVSFAPWITLSNTANPGTISTGASSTMTASFLQNSGGQSLTASQIAALIGLPVTWNGAVHGTFSGQQTTIQANGEATALFTNDGTCNDGIGNAVIDNATATANVTVHCCPTITASPKGSTAVCPGGSATVTVTVSGGTPPYSVTLDNGGGTQVGNSPLDFTVSPSSLTTYSVSSGTDANGCTVAGNGTVTISVNAPPAAGADTLGTVENTAVSAPVPKLLANDSSPIAGPLSISSVSSPSAQHGTVTLGGGVVTYTPSLNFVGTDSFTYTLSDGRCTASGTVIVTVTAAGAQSLNQVSITGTLPHVTILLVGVPTQVYVMQWAPTATGPWTDFTDGTLTADSTGLVTYTDSTQAPPPARFFRTRVGP